VGRITTAFDKDITRWVAKRVARKEVRHIVGSEGVQQAKGMSVSGRYEDRYHSMWEGNKPSRASALYLSAENWTNTAKPIGTLTRRQGK
jgi:hypothetical protein